MLMQAGVSESEIIERLKAKRNPEPVEPTEESAEPESEDTQVLDDSTTDELESESSEELGESDDDGEESEGLFYEIDGEEVTLDTILGWKNGHMMQSDYTRKTKEVSEQRKSISAKEAEIKSLADSLDSTVKSLESELMKEFDGINWDDLRDMDTSEYLKKKEQMEAKRKLIESAKATQSKANSAIDQTRLADEQRKLYEALPHWSDETKRNEDVKVISSFAKSIGYTDSELANMHDHRQIVALLKAGRLAEIQSSDPKNSKKVKKKSNITKPTTKRAATNLERQIEEAKAKLKQTGKVDDAVALRKLQRQRGK